MGQHPRCIARITAAGFKVVPVVFDPHLDVEVACGPADPRSFAGEILSLPIGQDVLSIRLIVIVRSAKRFGPIFIATAYAHHERPGSLVAPVGQVHAAHDWYRMTGFLRRANRSLAERFSSFEVRSRGAIAFRPNSMSRQCPERPQ